MSSIALCVPAYNAAWCLPRLLESAHAQEIPFNEILVYNDCSSDNTVEVAKQHGAKVISGKKNMGCAYGKNKLAEIAQSDWLHFHDADDELLPNFNTIAHNWFVKTEIPDIILLNFDYVEESTQKLLVRTNYNRKALIRDTKKFVIETKLVNFAIINRNSFLNINGFDTTESVLYNEDRAFYSKAIVHNLSFDIESEVTCINYAQSKSMSNSNALKCAWAHYHVSIFLEKNLGKQYPKEIANCYWENAKNSATQQDWKLTKLNINHAIGLNSEIPTEESAIVKLISFIHPFFAFWFREKMIRIIKSKFR